MNPRPLRPLLFLFILFSMSVMQKTVAQNGPHPVPIYGQPPPTSILTYIGAGFIIPNSTGKDQAYLTNSLCVNADVYIPIIKKKTFSFGINAGGEYAFSNKDPLKTLPSPFHVIGETSSIVSSSGKSKQQSFKVGAGPQANFYLGKHLIVSPIFIFSRISIDIKDYNVEQTTVIDDNTYKYTLLSQTQTKINGLALIPKLRFQYFINRRIGFWAEANYTMGPTIKNTVSTFIPEGNPDNNGQYEFDQLQNGTIRTSTLPPGETKFKSFGVHIGVVFSILDRPHPEDDPLH